MKTTTKQHFLRLLAIATVALTTPDLSAQFGSYGISKNGAFMQCSVAPPSAVAWSFSAHLHAGADGEVTEATIDTPTGQQLTERGDRFLFFSSSHYPSRTALDLAFPSGAYTFAVTAGTLASASASVSFPAENEFPATVPSFNRETVEGLKSYDACKSFRFTWDAFTPHPNANDSYISFRIVSAERLGEQVFYSFDRSTNCATVPGGTLKPDTAYRAILQFSNGTRTRYAGLGDFDSLVDFSYSTTFEFTTLPEAKRTKLSLRSSQVELSWPTTTNTLYQLQYRSPLTTNRWVALGTPIPGDGTCKSVYEDVPQGRHRRVYRVVVAFGE